MLNSNKYSILIIVLILHSQIAEAPERAHEEQVPFRIINGEPCSITEVPFFVIIAAKETCGGCLITYRLVLSAAHCMLSKKYGLTSTVHSGHDMLPKFQQFRYFKDVFRHPEFDEVSFMAGTELRYDIGIILVDEPFSPSEALQLVKVPNIGYSKQCKRALVAGIGLARNDEEHLNKQLGERVLNCANLKIIDIDTCKKSFPRATIDNKIICTNQTEKDPCLGDSGGPLICNNYLIGIVSYGSKPCAGTVPATYTRIEQFTDFIDQIKSQFPEIISKRGGINVTNEEKASAKSFANIVRGWAVNCQMVFFTLFYWFVLCLLLT